MWFAAVRLSQAAAYPEHPRLYRAHINRKTEVRGMADGQIARQSGWTSDHFR